MLILLPPSETKAAGGEGPPLDLSELAFADHAGVTRTRSKLLAALISTSRRPRVAMAALALGATQRGELLANLDVRSSPTMPAIERYTGVLYDALDVASLSQAARRRAGERIAICSALFGLVDADDPIPAYRLSGGSRLPRVGSLPALWKPVVGPALAAAGEQHLVVDLRSGPYRSLAPAPRDALTVRVLSERSDGSRGVVSHWSKSTKGALARLLVVARTECRSTDDVARIASSGGLTVEQPAAHVLDVVLPPS